MGVGAKLMAGLGQNLPLWAVGGNVRSSKRSSLQWSALESCEGLREIPGLIFNRSTRLRGAKRLAHVRTGGGSYSTSSQTALPFSQEKNRAFGQKIGTPLRRVHRPRAAVLV